MDKTTNYGVEQLSRRRPTTPRLTQAKRVPIVSLRMVRESSVMYKDRQIRSALDALELVAPILQDADREKFVVVCLDAKNQPTSLAVVSVGSLDASLVHPREVFKVAVVSNAVAILCAHNHPSGRTEPSTQDVAVTNRLCEAGRIIGIDVLDHIVAGSEGRFTSLKAEGLM